MKEFTLYSNQVSVNLTPGSRIPLAFLACGIRLEHSKREATIKIHLAGDLVDYQQTHQELVQFLYRYAKACELAAGVAADNGDEATYDNS